MAARLLQSSLEAMQTAEWPWARLYVLESNMRARAFYEKAGWLLDRDLPLKFMASTPDVGYRFDFPGANE